MPKTIYTQEDIDNDAIVEVKMKVSLMLLSNEVTVQCTRLGIDTIEKAAAIPKMVDVLGRMETSVLSCTEYADEIRAILKEAGVT